MDAGGPKIAFANLSHDFGTVTEGDKLRHVFVLKNPGKEPLLISGARASCGCTVAALKSKSIPPGGNGEIDATFDTHNRVGLSRTTITVESNATGQAQVTLTLTANVERLLALESGYVRVATEYGVPHVEKVWLTGKLLNAATPKVLKLESQRRASTPVDADKDPIFNALSVRPIEEQAGGAVKKGLELALKGDKVTSGSGKVIFATGLPKPENLELNLTWAVTSTLQVEPDSLRFDAGQQGQERVLLVRSKRPKFRLLRVRVLDGPFSAAIERPESDGVFKVKVIWKRATSRKARRSRCRQAATHQQRPSRAKEVGGAEASRSARSSAPTASTGATMTGCGRRDSHRRKEHGRVSPVCSEKYRSAPTRIRNSAVIQ